MNKYSTAKFAMTMQMRNEAVKIGFSVINSLNFGLFLTNLSNDFRRSEI